MARAWCIFSVGVVVGLFAGPAAHAETKSDDVEAARQHYGAGTKDFSLGDFSGAIEEYKLAFKAKPDPVYLYNIAQAYRLSGDLRQALFFYKSYLNSSPDAENRDEVVDRINTLNRKVQQPLAPTTTGSSKPSAPNDTSKNSESTVGAGFRPAGPRPRSATEAATVAGSRRSDRAEKPVYKKWWLWTVVGVAVAGGVATAVILTRPSGTWSTTPAIGPGANAALVSW